jgi:hypothetical protein
MKKKDPPGYPGDEAVNQAISEALREICLEKGLSLEETDALFQTADQDVRSMVPRALGIVVRQLREKQGMSRAQLGHASGLSVRFIGVVERGRAHNATITDAVRISFGLNHPVIDLVTQVYEVSKKLSGK